MSLLRLAKVSLAYGHRQLLEAVDLELELGERVCLVGRNGEGKSSLLRAICGQAEPDDGTVWIRPGVRCGYLAQEVALDTEGSTFDVVAGGVPDVGRLLSAYHAAAARVARSPGAAQVRRLAELQHELELAGGWQLEPWVESVMSRLGLDGTSPVQTLSGGWRRRVMLARALVGQPELLLLDEPTNHLDIDAIAWLEAFLLEYPGALLFVSHDRALVRRLATRVVELDRGRLRSWAGGYDDYMRRKAARLETEAHHNAQLDKKLSREEAWIRQGIKARRTRNEGRVRALEALREQRRQRRDPVGRVELRLEQAERSGRLVFEAERVSHGFGGVAVIHDFSVRILRGDRVGIIGPNGAGKSTLIRLLLGELTPDSGCIRRGTRLRTAHFEQERRQLDPAVTVMDAVAGGSTTVTIDGRPQHVAGYLRKFLFPAARLRSPVSALSGGERNRLLLARLLAQPANLLVLDEPTNDLDVETLELLEELVLDFQGTLLLVSHDRAFLDNAVTSTLVFEGEGRIREYVGGYSDWSRHRADQSAARQPPPRGALAAAPVAARSRLRKPHKLSYKEQRELEAMPARIEALEADQTRLRATVSDGEFYRQEGDAIAATLARLESISEDLDACYARWQTLEGK